MFKHGEVNPLSVFGLRRMEHCPPHFIKVAFDIYISDKIISDWIYENLTGRFYLGEQYSAIEESKNTTQFFMQKLAAFEIPGEASMFALTLDTINQHPFW